MLPLKFNYLAHNNETVYFNNNSNKKYAQFSIYDGVKRSVQICVCDYAIQQLA